MSLQPTDEETEAWGREMAYLGHFMAGAKRILVWPDLCPQCLSTPFCMKGTGRTRKRGGAPPGALSALDLDARLSKKQTV